MTTIIDGKLCAKKILDDLKQKTKKLQKKPALAVILANDDASSKVYVASKEKHSLDLGFDSCVYRFDKSITQGELIKLIHELNENPNINGILVQLPLFKHLNSQEIIELINPKKDVDGFHPINVGKLNCGLEPYAICCTPKGIIKLLKEYKINLTGKNAIVIGRSNIVGKPTATLLTNENATVTLAHSKTKNLKELTKNADIIISATGVAKLIKADMVKKGAVVIDVGINKQANGKLIGDVDFEKVKNIASYITPVPGGVGPMTIACLMENTYELFLAQNKGII
ncbi:MAG: bifunctional 5,10-methylenetetrahydrofolate dehydrogenase/5,10-methenyltetrahydrofolate cyclohydrolase [Candidatus Gastranaerophilales bacterium]|nr:bifunctional 5,10-methylenetetrahydrofolate dehydrogenase/5,10-methenyltetrahydrofolate cyclohydrolase [Candidatus Gastranaerophilales bacterium]